MDVRSHTCVQYKEPLSARLHERGSCVCGGLRICCLPLDRQTDSCFRDRSRTPHERLCAAPPPYARTRGCAPVGSPIGWAVLLLTSTSRARTRRASRTARTLAVQDGLGAWGGG